MVRSATGSPAAAEDQSVRSAASQIQGLLGDDGNIGDGQMSRGHPDYDPNQDERAGGTGRQRAPRSEDLDDDNDSGRGKQPRDEQGKYKKKDETGDNDDDFDDNDLDDNDADDVDDDDSEEHRDTSEGDDEAGSDDDGTDAIDTLAKLAEALEMPLDELAGTLTHSFRAAGEDVTVTLAELEKGYQKDADYRRSTAQLADKRRELDAETTQRMQQFDQQAYVGAQHMNAVANLLMTELNSPEMQRLRQEDTAEWNARQTEINQRIGVLNNFRQEAAANYENFRQQMRLNARTQGEQVLKEALPDFGSQHIDTARKVMESLNYQPQEIAEIFDPRTILGALELATLREKVAQYEKQIDDAKKATHKVKQTVPKTVKPGKTKRIGKKQIDQDNLARLSARAKKSGKLEDAAKVIENLL